MTPKEQQAALSGPEVIHFRIPLKPEPGIELIPGTHRRWDRAEELDVRLERNNRSNYEHLNIRVAIALAVGDLKRPSITKLVLNFKPLPEWEQLEAQLMD